MHFLAKLDEGKRYRNWVFTYNNPEEDWKAEDCYVGSNARYLTGQYERGGETGTLHVQGYVIFKDPVGLAGAKRKLKLLNAHFEVRRGTHQEAHDYCNKEDTRVPDTVPFCFGEPPLGQGARSDINECKRILDDSGSLVEVADQQFGTYCRYHRAFEAYQGLRSHPRDTPPEVHYFWGPAGSGKTRAVWEVGAPERVYPVPLDPSGRSVWFDGYRPGFHTIILMDDFYHNFRLSFLLQLLDRYPMFLPRKGGFIPIANCSIYITSNISLEDQYPNAPDKDAIRRRFTTVVHFDNVQNLG